MVLRNIFSKLKKLFLRIRSRILTEYTIMHLYPAIYKKYASKPCNENKVIFVESRLATLSNSFRIMYSTLEAETDYELSSHFLRKTFVDDLEYVRNCKALIKDMATAKCIFMD